jgi:hypothetical protein
MGFLPFIINPGTAKNGPIYSHGSRTKDITYVNVSVPMFTPERVEITVLARQDMVQEAIQLRLSEVNTRLRLLGVEEDEE